MKYKTIHETTRKGTKKRRFVFVRVNSWIAQSTELRCMLGHGGASHCLSAPCRRSISIVRSIGKASTVCPRPVVVVARNSEL